MVYGKREMLLLGSLWPLKPIYSGIRVRWTESSFRSKEDFGI